MHLVQLDSSRPWWRWSGRTQPRTVPAVCKMHSLRRCRLLSVQLGW